MQIQCRELTLPPSDLAHKADLVHLFLTEESKLPSALAVSPEGSVRYWPNINHEGSSVDAVTDLQGQECFSLTSVFVSKINLFFHLTLLLLFLIYFSLNLSMQ